MSPPLNLCVHATCCEAQGIVSVELRDIDGKTLPKYAPGAHIELHLGDGLVRSYSPCDAPEVCDHYVVSVLFDRNSRGDSCYTHGQSCVGSMLKTGGPRNHSEVDETAPYTVLVAGDTGVTPIVCMVRRLVERGKTFPMLYYAHSCAGATPADGLVGRDDVVRFHLDAEAGGPPDLKALPAGHSIDTHLYCCGPGPMLHAFEAAYEALGYTNVRVERFAAGPDAELVQDGGYQVKLARNGTELCVPTGKPLLDVPLEVGVEMEHNCKEDVCGSCEARVLEGKPDHRDNVLSKSECASNQTMMVCVSGYKGEHLVIDL